MPTDTPANTPTEWAAAAPGSVSRAQEPEPSGARRYRKRPVVIEAMQVADDLAQVYRVAEWIHRHGGQLTDPMGTLDCAFRVRTLEGDMAVQVGDWVIRGVQGEFYPCKPQIFDATYEPVAEPAAAQDGPTDPPSVPAAGPTPPPEGDSLTPTPPDALGAAQAAIAAHEFAGVQRLSDDDYAASCACGRQGPRRWRMGVAEADHEPHVIERALAAAAPHLAAAALRTYADRHHAHPGGPDDLVRELWDVANRRYLACRACGTRLDDTGACTRERPRLLRAADRLARGEPDPADPPRPGTKYVPEEVGRG